MTAKFYAAIYLVAIFGTLGAIYLGTATERNHAENEELAASIFRNPPPTPTPTP